MSPKSGGAPPLPDIAAASPTPPPPPAFGSQPGAQKPKKKSTNVTYLGQDAVPGPATRGGATLLGQ